MSKFVPPSGDIVEALTGIVGVDRCMAPPPSDSPYLADFRQLYRGKATAVVLPADTAEVAAVMQACARHRRAVVPHGGNTGLCGGTAPSAHGSDVVVSLERMRAVRSIDLVNDTITVDAGCILQNVQSAAAEAGRFFPLSLGAEGSCQIGGNVATNAGGHAVLRYGNTRDLVLGLEVVLPSGEVLGDLRGLRKNNAGYDLKQLFIGSEGTLGIVTGVTLKLFPARRQVETALLALDSLDDVVALYTDARRRADEFLTAFELMPRNGIEKAMRHVPDIADPFPTAYAFYVLIEMASSQTLLGLQDVLADLAEDNLAKGRILDGVVASSLRDTQTFWRMREAVVEAQRLAGPSFKHDISVPLGAMARFVETTTAAILDRHPQVEVIAFGHIGDGNIHFNVCIGENQPAGEFRAAQLSIEALVYDAVAACGGSFSAEHGIGLSKRDALTRYASPQALELMAGLKRLLDPHKLLNPGKVLPEPSADGAAQPALPNGKTAAERPVLGEREKTIAAPIETAGAQ